MEAGQEPANEIRAGREVFKKKMAAEGEGPEERREKKGDSDGVVADRFGGNIIWVRQSKRHRGKASVSESPTHWRHGGPAPGGPGGWCPERGPSPGRWRSPTGACARGLGPAGGHLPVTMRPSRQGVCLGVARTGSSIDRS